MVKNSPASVRDTGSIPGLRRSPEEGNDYLLQCSCLGNPMNRGVWRATACGVTKNWIVLRELSVHVIQKAVKRDLQ